MTSEPVEVTGTAAAAAPLPGRHRRDPATALPADGHVHSEWSWDAVHGSMERTCARAVELGLPSVAFTEHADFTVCAVPEGVELPEWWRRRVTGHLMTPPDLDVDGYRDCLDRCRDRFPTLRILSGVELGEPHWHADRVAALFRRASFDRVLASLHSLPVGGQVVEMAGVYGGRPAGEVIRTYLAEVERLIGGFDAFDVLAHIDFPVRYWPVAAGAFDVETVGDAYRGALAALATAGKTLEVSTRVPLAYQVLRWWRQQGGRTIAFASDAHAPHDLARGFADAAALAEAAGFRAGGDQPDGWVRA